MRFALIMALTFAGTSLFAEAAAGASDKGKEASAKAAVNTNCVGCGKPVDAKVAPIAGKTKEGKEVMMGCCSDACATEVKKNPDQFADAAVANKAWKKEDAVKGGDKK